MGSEHKNHWETVYETKDPHEVSWTQKVPTTSLDLIRAFGLACSAKIIDVGGGDSNLTDHLLEAGFDNITVLDISAKALEKAMNRLGGRAKKVNWVNNDITEYEPDRTFDVWHDRAAFHFLTNSKQINKYISLVKKSVNGYLIIGTFSEDGPRKCSGLDIKQYNEAALDSLFEKDFEKIRCITEDHVTPFNTTQNFLFCVFKRKAGGPIPTDKKQA